MLDSLWSLSVCYCWFLEFLVESCFPVQPAASLPSTSDLLGSVSESVDRAQGLGGFCNLCKNWNLEDCQQFALDFGLKCSGRGNKVEESWQGTKISCEFFSLPNGTILDWLSTGLPSWWTDQSRSQRWRPEITNTYRQKARNLTQSSKYVVICRGKRVKGEIMRQLRTLHCRVLLPTCTRGQARYLLLPIRNQSLWSRKPSHQSCINFCAGFWPYLSYLDILMMALKTVLGITRKFWQKLKLPRSTTLWTLDSGDRTCKLKLA